MKLGRVRDAEAAIDDAERFSCRINPKIMSAKASVLSNIIPRRVEGMRAFEAAGEQFSTFHAMSALRLWHLEECLRVCAALRAKQVPLFSERANPAKLNFLFLRLRRAEWPAIDFPARP